MVFLKTVEFKGEESGQKRNVKIKPNRQDATWLCAFDITTPKANERAWPERADA